MVRFLILFLFSFVLHAVDYDCAFIGSSPISLCEALYRSSLGERVLILEQSPECGGAWKSIDICGIPHVDMGCHDVTWSDQNLTKFFEDYLGCRIVSFSNPALSVQSGSCWFSRGCYELIHNILTLIAQTSIDLRLNHRLERVTFNPTDHSVVLAVEGMKFFTAKKIYTTPLSSFAVNQQPVPTHRGKYYHLYLLVADATMPKFVSGYLGASGVSRMMNLTHSANLDNSGRQLIVLQTSSEADFSRGQYFLDQLKQKNFLDPSAYLLRAESYIFEATYGGVNIHQLTPEERSCIEMLHTGSLGGMSSYISKWKQTFKPLNKASSF